MMLTAVKTEIYEDIDDLLQQWHRYCAGYQYIGYSSVCKQFKDTPSNRQWDSVESLADEGQYKSTMKAVQFAVEQMEPIFRTALQIAARNLVTGQNVWNSPRLPQDPFDRAALVADAKIDLRRRLVTAGVL